MADQQADVKYHGLDTSERVCFYEQEFYVLSNFSSFKVEMHGHDFDTAEAAYHYTKFAKSPHPGAAAVCQAILTARSAHAAFKIAQVNKEVERPDWKQIRLDVMREILLLKAIQHEYVRRKLLETGDRLLVENSWRDNFWGEGADGTGANWLGRLWMETRDIVREGVRLSLYD